MGPGHEQCYSSRGMTGAMTAIGGSLIDAGLIKLPSGLSGSARSSSLS